MIQKRVFDAIHIPLEQYVPIEQFAIHNNFSRICLNKNSLASIQMRTGHVIIIIIIHRDKAD